MTTQPATPYTNILAAIDGTEHRHRLLAAVADLATMTGASVDVLHVDADSSAFDTGADMEDAGAASALVMTAVAELRERGVDAHGLVAHAADVDVDDEILATATRRASTLVALGPHHRKGLRAWLESSVTDQISHQAATPLLLIP